MISPLWVRVDRPQSFRMFAELDALYALQFRLMRFFSIKRACGSHAWWHWNTTLSSITGWHTSLLVKRCCTCCPPQLQIDCHRLCHEREIIHLHESLILLEKPRRWSRSPGSHQWWWYIWYVRYGCFTYASTHRNDWVMTLVMFYETRFSAWVAWKDDGTMCVGDGKQYVVVAINTLPLHLPFE